MADAANRSQRAAALEEKRRKLEDMKKKRALRDQGSSAAAAANRTAASANLDDYIDGLLEQPSAAGSPAAVPGTATQTGTDETAAADNNNNNSAAAPAPSGSAGAASPVAPTTTEVRPPAPPPKPAVESFTAGTQTEEEDFVEQPALVEPEEEEPEATSEIPEAPAPSAATEPRAPSLLTPDQVAQEVTRTDFGSFLTTASKKVERLLGNAEWTSSLLVDSLGDDQPSSEKDANASEAAAADRWIPSRQVYEAGKWTATRDVTDVSWSTHHRDVFLATYHAPRRPYSAPSPAPVAAAAASSSSMMTPRSGELQADGLALLWNLSMPTRPEHVLTCASPVLKGRLVPQQPHLVLGGCASGQVVVWDVRSGGRYPVQTSALTTLSPTAKQQQQGHVHPICGMEVTDGGAGLVTTSTDGRVNFWSMSNLREPVESLLIPGGSVACLAVAPESESLVLGDEQGSLYSVMTTTTATGGNTKKTSTRRKQVRKWETAAESDGATPAPGHYGMVTSVATRMRVAQGTGLVKGFSRGSAGLVLTTGVDWTTQLWAPAYKDTPLMSWTSHSYDSVSAVAWNPQNPGVWASASSNGSIGLWNLAHSLDEALTDGVMVDDGLMQLSWSSDGRRLAVAGAGGRVHLLTVADEVMRPKGDEDAKIVSQLVTRGLISRP